MNLVTENILAGSNPLIGIVILNWNGWQDTVECLYSLKGLIYENYRIYVVDNASTNDSVAQIKSRFPGITMILSAQNGGFSKGNNLGITAALEAGANFVWLLNNDTTVSTFSLTYLVNEAISRPKLGILGSVLHEYFKPWLIQAWGGGNFNKFLGTTSVFKDRKECLGHIIGASMFLRREMIENIGFLNEEFFFFLEDTEYSLRAKNNEWEIDVAEDSYVFHKGGSSLGGQTDVKSLQSDLLFVHSVGRFMRITEMPFSSVAFRLIAIILQRLLRRQADRIIPITKVYFKGYRR
jgi:GT2 family glycosyltransferase